MADNSTAGSARGLYGISVTSELSGIAPQTLRLYERRGLLAPARTDGGTRRYSDEDLQRLQRITELVDQGVNLAGVAQILDLETKNSQLLSDYTQLELRHAQLKVSRQSAASRRSDREHREQRREVPIMTDIDYYRVMPDNASEVDAIDQRLVVDADDDTGLDTTHLDALGDWDVNEADVIDQATIVPAPRDMIETLSSASLGPAAQGTGR